MKNIGVMQGRLLPKYMGKYQAHPAGYWKKEYSIAKKLGLDSIEFIFDYLKYDKNPLYTKKGIDEIQEISNSTGIKTKSVCADYFMESPLFHYDENIRKENENVLKNLIFNCSLLGVTDIVIPCVDNSSIKSGEQKKIFIETVKKHLPDLEKYNINFSLETDLPPYEFAELLSKFTSKNVTVNYDIGNSASLGYSFIEELNCYGKKITNVHIKDRVLNGPSVVLGEGDAHIAEVFSEMSKMQAYRDEEGIAIFKKQLSYVNKILNDLCK